MKREDVIKLFPDATEEQITSALNAFHKEIDDAKDKAKSVRDENAAKVAELQAQIDAFNSKDDSELEKIQKKLDKVSADYDKAQKTIKNMELVGAVLELTNYLAKKEVTPAYYDIQLKYRDSRDDESGEMLDLIFDSRTFDLGCAYGWGGIMGQYMQLNTNVASRFESVITAAETALQDMLDTIDFE